MSDLDKRFVAAQKAARSLRDRPANDTLLELHWYFKQAFDGDVAGQRPEAFEFVARAKYDAWVARKGMKRDVALRGYLKFVEHLQSLED